ncbi:MAG: amidohydrolase [Veillonellaceae bacterium]|nr:amidohydrolase [Veillonellaceae bacterium]
MNWETLRADAEKIKPEVINLRRHFHMHPELSRQEEKTVALVQQILEGLGIATHRVAGTGLVGLLQGKGSGKTVGIRADMDALPMHDGKQVEYASREEGKMHACGHDAHTAGLLGAAMLLSQYRDRFSGNVKFLFQPAEENGGGALPMIEAGVMENPHVDAVFGLHVNHELDAGTVGFRYGQFYAAADMMEITVHGQSAHGARPHVGVDAILVASQIVTALQSFVSRNVNPIESAVVTIGKFVGGYQRNIIADKVELSGTVRTLSPAVRAEAQTRLTKLVQGIAESFGATAEVQYILGYPTVINDEAMTEFARRSAEELLGVANVSVITEPKMGGEDFAFFLQKAPGTFYQLGVRNKAKGIVHPTHTHLFDIDEEALAIGAAVHAKLALDFLAG